MKRIVWHVFLWTFLVLLFFVGEVGAEQIYTVNGNRMLLYKVINWWYDAAPEDAMEPCGLRVECRAEGETVLQYDKGNRILKLSVGESFADLISVTGSANDGTVLEYSAKVDRGELAGKVAKMTIREFVFRNTLTLALEPISPEQFAELSGRSRYFDVTLGGSIAGLMDGKVSLVAAADMIYSCPSSSGNHQQQPAPGVLEVVDRNSGSILLGISFPAVTTPGQRPVYSSGSPALSKQ